MALGKYFPSSTSGFASPLIFICQLEFVQSLRQQGLKRKVRGSNTCRVTAVVRLKAYKRNLTFSEILDIVGYFLSQKTSFLLITSQAFEQMSFCLQKILYFCTEFKQVNPFQSLEKTRPSGNFRGSEKKIIYKTYSDF